MYSDIMVHNQLYNKYFIYDNTFHMMNLINTAWKLLGIVQNEDELITICLDKAIIKINS
jgi:hypothetical protein